MPPPLHFAMTDGAGVNRAGRRAGDEQPEICRAMR